MNEEEFEYPCSLPQCHIFNESPEFDSDSLPLGRRIQAQKSLIRTSNTTSTMINRNEEISAYSGPAFDTYNSILPEDREGKPLERISKKNYDCSDNNYKKRKDTKSRGTTASTIATSDESTLGSTYHTEIEPIQDSVFTSFDYEVRDEKIIEQIPFIDQNSEGYSEKPKANVWENKLKKRIPDKYETPSSFLSVLRKEQSTLSTLAQPRSLEKILKDCLKVVALGSPNNWIYEKLSEGSYEEKKECLNKIADYFHDWIWMPETNEKAKKLGKYMKEFWFHRCKDLNFKELDLHRLLWEDVEELFDYVKIEIQKDLEKASSDGPFKITVILGRGKNSSNGARLFPKFAAKLKRENIAHNPQNGRVIVYIMRSE